MKSLSILGLASANQLGDTNNIHSAMLGEIKAVAVQGIK
tara:strand:- start:1079 stop:1195 length:117 start_codon:yes stop_codon:yes gene_type:complete